MYEEEDIRLRLIMGIIFGGSVATLVLLSISCTPIRNFLFPYDDSLLEEIVEAQIERYVGVDIDLTPTSEET
mgnify:CR=1 FL=1